MRKKILVTLALGTLFFTACGEQKIKEENVKKETRQQLIIAQEGEPKTLDVHSGNDGFSLRINKQLYSRLVE
ncbi:MAG: glutathione ABC transporter substrate-binding protein, partial [Fusobacteriaceae bacterium]